MHVNKDSKAYREEYRATSRLIADTFPYDAAGLNAWTLGALDAVLASPSVTTAASCVQRIAAVLDATQSHADKLRVASKGREALR